MQDSDRINEKMCMIGRQLVLTDAPPKNHVGPLVICDAILEVARQIALLREELQESKTK